MHLLHRLRAFLRLAFGRNRAEQELDENLSSYLAMLTDEKIAAGMSPGKAARAARIELGGVEQVKERVREIRPLAWLETLVRDVRYALRGLRRRPGFTATVVTTLAIAIGANTAIFTIVNAVALQPPPGIDDPRSLVDITQGSGSTYIDVSYAVVDHLRRNATTVEDLAPSLRMRFALGEPGEAPEVVPGLLITGNYFSVLGVNGSMGRLFAPEDSFYPATGDSVVISHRYWQRRYQGHPGAIGETLMVNGTPLTVVGVTPPGFVGHMAALQNDVFVLIGTPAAGLPDAASLDNVANNEFMAVGRLAEGASPAAASHELTALATEFAPQAGPRGVYEIRVEPYGPLPGPARHAAFGLFAVLLIVVGLVMAIACVNVTGMLLSRAIERGREIAVRQALGAGRARLARQLLTESVVLFLLAAPLGMLLSIWVTRLLWSLVPALPVSVELDLSPDGTVLAFTLLVAAIAGVVSGLAPALQATRPDLVPTLKGDGTSQVLRPTRLRRVLVVVQMTATLVLLVAAGLFLRALEAAQTVDLGFRPENAQVALFDLELNGYDTIRSKHFFGELRRKLRAEPGVRRAAAAHKLPIGSRSSVGDVRAAGFEPPPGEYGITMDFLVVDGEYFRTVGIPLVRGRSLEPTDTRVAVVNETMAQRLWPGQDAVGRRFSMGPDEPGYGFTVVGVAEDARYHGLVQNETPSFGYLSLGPGYLTARSDMHVLWRHEAGQAVGRERFRAIVRELDPAVPILSFEPLMNVVEGSYFTQRIAAWVTGVLGFVGLVLGAVGIYGVASYSVSQRRHEIGVRIALGAGAADVRRLVVRQGMLAPLLGMACGLAVAFALTRFLAHMLVGVSPLDPWAFVAVLTVLTMVAFGANYIPAHRASRLDPTTTLRSE